MTLECEILPVRFEDAAGAVSATLVPGSAERRRAAILSVCGEVDLRAVPLLRDAMLASLEHGGGPVVIDLSDVSFMDSTGVHFLVDAHRQLERRKRRLAIACREVGQVHRLLAVVGLLDALAVYPSRGGAVRGVEGGVRSERRSGRQPFGFSTGGADGPRNNQQASLRER